MPEPLRITPFDIAQRYVGIAEVPGTGDNAAIVAMLQLDNSWAGKDSVAWCSAFVNHVAWVLRLPRSKSLAARSWLGVGIPVTTPEIGFDVAVFKRGTNPAEGHVGFFAGFDPSGKILVLGGNQGDKVSIAPFAKSDLLGYRRLTLVGA